MSADQVQSEFRPEIRSILQDYATGKSIKALEVNKNCFMSDVLKCQVPVIQNGADKVRNRLLIVKQIPRDPNYVKIFNCRTAFRNECYAYKSILPALRKYSPRELPIPECIYASEGLLILEDLTGDGFQHFDKLTGFTVDVVKSVLIELANLHAASLIMKHQNKPLFDAITCVVEEVLYVSGGDNSHLMTQERSIEMVLEMMQEAKFSRHSIKLIDQLKGECLEQQTLLRRRDKFAVINHGDLWAQNMLRKKTQIKLIDFQIMRLTSVAADLTYFLCVNLDPDFCVKYKDQFLEFYLKELVGNVRTARLPIERELTMEWLKREMEVYAVYGFITGLWVLPVFFRQFNVEKDAEEFAKQPLVSAQTIIETMGAEERDRTLRLVSSFVKESKMRTECLDFIEGT